MAGDPSRLRRPVASEVFHRLWTQYQWSGLLLIRDSMTSAMRCVASATADDASTSVRTLIGGASSTRWRQRSSLEINPMTIGAPDRSAKPAGPKADDAGIPKKRIIVPLRPAT